MLVWAAACGVAAGAAQAETDPSFLLTATPEDFADHVGRLMSLLTKDFDGDAVNLITATTSQQSSGDVNKDGKLDIKDATLILRQAVGL